MSPLEMTCLLPFFANFLLSCFFLRPNLLWLIVYWAFCLRSSVCVCVAAVTRQRVRRPPQDLHPPAGQWTHHLHAPSASCRDVFVSVKRAIAFVFPGWREESELKAVHGRADLIPGQWNNPILPTIAKCFASKLQNVVKAEVWLQPSGVRPDPSIILLQPQPCRKTSSESARCYQRPLWSHLVFVCSATARLCVQE